MFFVMPRAVTSTKSIELELTLKRVTTARSPMNGVPVRPRKLTSGSSEIFWRLAWALP